MHTITPKISVIVPIHPTMKNGQFFLWRLVQSLMKQTFKDYELIITQEGSMPVNTNAGIKKAKGELIKILYLDDYFAHQDALKCIVENFMEDDMWLATGCLHQDSSPDTLEEPHSPHIPFYSPDIYLGNNTIGSPSVITIRNDRPLLFDEHLSYLLDGELYHRYFKEYGPPKLMDDLNVVIGLHDGQTSNTMSQRQKLQELAYVTEKYHG